MTALFRGRLPGLFLALLCAGVLFPGTLCPQTNPPGEVRESSYLIPQTVFVGDRGRLVVPLEPAFLKVPPLVIQDPVSLPAPGDLVINRIELEHRGGIPRLLVDFIAYAPGVLSLPPLDIPVPQDVEVSVPLARPGFARLTGLRLTVSSILNGETLVLAPPALPLAVPGTALMIYGSVAGFILLFIGIIGGRRWGRDRLRRWGESWRRRRLIILLGNILKRLRRNFLRGKPGLPGTGELLDRVSGEFRTFLGLFTGINCRTLTAGEFSDFSPGEISGEGPPRISGSALRDLFRRWDTLRFSGKDISGEEFLAALDELLAFLAVLAAAERQNRQGDAPGPAPSGLSVGGAG